MNKSLTLAHPLRTGLMLLPLLLAACTDSPDPTAAACVQPPAYSVAEAKLAAALVCPTPLAPGGRTPVLLVPGTTLKPQENFGWNYIPALQQLNWPYCTVELPGNAMLDIQDAAEYVAYAIREMHRRSSQKVQVVGYSQGGMVPRWALRFWPDTQTMVEDMVSLAGSHHGTLTAQPACQPDCAVAFHQQKNDARFIAALNAGGVETWPAVQYTAIYTHNDEVVTPNNGPNPSSALKAGSNVTNVAVQSVCPTNTSEHLAIGSYDPVGWALVKDALENPGPANPARIPVTVCAQQTMPGVNQSRFAQDFAAMTNAIQAAIAAAPRSRTEPPLKCYVPPA